MVKVELSYNPYLLETIVKFNGQEPRINSLVEKYQYGKMQEWINLIPSYMHDEMNGYGFELDYSGVKADFNRLIAAFKKAGVQDEDVVFFYRNELENPLEKKTRMNELLHWLENSRNRRFNYELFREENKEIMDTPYSYITIHGNNADSIELAGESVNVENVEDVKELASTDLSDTPIVMYIDESDSILNRNNLMYLIKKEDVKDEQVFFCISPRLNKQQVERIISDLGMQNPKIIEKMDDPLIEDYFEVYPLTNYVKRLLDKFREKTNIIQKELDEENEISRVRNFEIHAQIEAIEGDLRRLKAADDRFLQRDNLDYPNAFKIELQNMLDLISEWRRKKTKTNSTMEAEKMAAEYDEELEKMFIGFCERIKFVADAKKADIDLTFSNWYVETAVDSSFRPSVSYESDLRESVLPKLYGEFLQLKTEQMVDSKGSFFGIIKVSLDKEQKEKVLEITYSYEAWRARAEYMYKPIADMIITDRKNVLTQYYDSLSEIYHKHIEALIIKKTEQMNHIASQLTDDEKLLQIDNNWLETLKDKLHTIERG